MLERYREAKTRAYRDGQDAVRRKPHYSPSNPHEYDEEPTLAEAWEEGATSAGWNEIYTNGILNEEER
jgi:hypothetical protein